MFFFSYLGSFSYYFLLHIFYLCLSIPSSVFLFFFLSLFWERARVRTNGGRGREKGIERIPSRLHTVSTEPDVGLQLMNRDSMTWVKIRSQMLNWLRHPGTPLHPHLVFLLHVCWYPTFLWGLVHFYFFSFSLRWHNLHWFIEPFKWIFYFTGCILQLQNFH